MASQFFFRGPPLELVVTELVYFLIVFTLCLIVYFRTNILYQLTKHKGIFYFRSIFLFFSLAYLFRLTLVSILLGTEFGNFVPSRYFVGLLFTFVSFFSTMAILSMASVLIMKFFRARNLMPWLLIIAFFSSLVAFITRSHREFIFIQTLFFLGTVIFAFFQERKNPSRNLTSQNKITYFLLFVFWTLDGIALNRRLIPDDYKIPIHVLSALVFFWIFYRVNKRLTPDVKKKG